MKKFLLFSAAALAAAAATAATPAGVRVFDRSAQRVVNPVRKGVVLNADKSLEIARPLNAKEAAMRRSFTPLTVNRNANVVSRADEGETEEVVAHPYWIPEMPNYIGFLSLGNGDGTYLSYNNGGGDISELHQPCYTPVHYINASTVAEETDITTAFTWEYPDFSTMAMVDTVTPYLTIEPQPYYSDAGGFMNLSFADQVYEGPRYIIYGGTNYFFETDAQGNVLEAYPQCALPFNIGDPANEIGYASYFTINDAQWSQIYGAEIHQKGIGNILPAPEHPYGVTSIMMRCVINQMVSDSLRVSITKLGVEEETGRYYLDGELGYGYLTREEVESMMKAGYYRLLDIPLIEEYDGERYETWINIDSPVMITISGIDAAAGDQIYLCSAFTTDEDLITFGDTSVNWLEYNGKDLLLSAQLSYTNGKSNLGMALGLNNMYTFLDPETEATAYTSAPAEYVIPNEGGEVVLTYSPFYDLQELGAAEGEGAYEWWFDNYGEYNMEDGTQTCTISVDPLPEGVEGRQSTIRIEIPGAYRDIVVKQGNPAGLDAIQVAAADVKIAGGVITVNGRGNVEVYSLSGRKVKSAVSNGTVTIDANNLPAGVYLVKVGNKVAKIVK